MLHKKSYKQLRELIVEEKKLHNLLKEMIYST